MVTAGVYDVGSLENEATPAGGCTPNGGLDTNLVGGKCRVPHRYSRCVTAIHGPHGRVTPHVLRHSWTSAALSARVPQDQVQHDGGWADARMPGYYSHGQDQPDRATTHAVTAFIAGAA